MAKSVTLETMISDVRLYADQRGADVATDGFVTDAEITRLLNLELASLQDLLISCQEQDYYVSESTLSIVAGTSLYNLPATFYQLKSVTLEWGSQRFELVRPLNSIKGRKSLQNQLVWSEHTPKAWRLRNAQIEFLPTPTSAVTARLQYIPAFQDLVALGTFDGVNGWEKLPTLAVAMFILRIEQRTSEADALLPEYTATKERIEAMADDRAADDPIQIEDVESHHYDDWMGPWGVPSGSAE